MPPSLVRPATIPELQAAVRDHPRVLPRGGGTKPALSTPAGDAILLDLSALTGMVEYEPGEFTFTARAGTRLSEIAASLAEHGQFLPFDPPLVEAGATLGGTVASGLSGPGRYRYGGVRDFILGVRYVDGVGDLVRAGGKVVKNAAGFDIPKLMVGSLGSLGVLVDLTFKVFPQPQAYASVRLACPGVDAALAALHRLCASQLDVNALDLVPAEAGVALWARLGGLADALPARVERLCGLLGGGEAVGGQAEAGFWREGREFAWVPAGWTLVKVPLTPRRIPALELSLAGMQTQRRYSAGGQVAWIALAQLTPAFGDLLLAHELAGLVILGPGPAVRLGVRAGQAFERRIKAALDPEGRFREV